jgi:hypothetical protein
MDRVRRGASTRGGAGLCPHAEENLRDTDAHTKAAKEKDFHSIEKEIVLPHADPGKKIFTQSDAHAFTATEKETFTDTQTERDVGDIAKSNAFAAVKEKTFAHTYAERNAGSKSHAFADTNGDGHTFPLGITEKARRAEREPDPGPDQRLRKLFDQRAETSRLRPRTDQAQSRL